MAASIVALAVAGPSFGGGAADSTATDASVFTVVTGEALGAPLFATLEDYERATGTQISEFREAPMLAAMVAAGELPPVEERVGRDVQVVQPLPWDSALRK